MATQITPYLHLTEAIPGSNEPFSTAVHNGNLDAIDAFASTTNTRVTAVETWRTATTPDLAAGLVLQGTTAQRDTKWGIPATAADRVALAAKVPRWFNTDKGFTQQYFATQGDAGAGIFTRAAGNWYPAIDSGRVPLTAFTVANTGGTVTRDGGKVLVSTGCTAISLNNVFTADFDYYDFELNFFGTVASDMLWRARVAGVDNATANYARTRLSGAPPSSAIVLAESGQTAAWAMRYDTTNGGFYDFTMMNPVAASVRTFARGTGGDTGNYVQVLSSYYNTGLSHDGITFLTATGTFQGELRVYGRNPF